MLGLLAALLPAIGGLFSGGAKGQADERQNQNQNTLLRNNQELGLYNTQQNALLQALLAGDRGAMDRYGTQQSATTNAMQGRQAATSNALGQQSNEGLQRAQLGLQAPGIRAKQSVLGSLMKNLQDVDIQGPARQQGHVPTITGGMRPSNLDPQTRAHGEELMKAAMAAQLSGSDIPAATDFKSGIQDWDKSVLQAPPETDYAKGLLPGPTLGSYAQPGKGESAMSWIGLIGNLLGQIPKKPAYNPQDPMGGG